MMKKQFGKTVAGLAVAGVTMLASAGAMAAPMTSIADSWHNLGSGNNRTGTPNGGAVANHSSNTAEICVFCHTPHGGDTSAAVPLWNRVLGNNTYQRYSALGSSTFDANEVPIGSVTIACLSCHDGTQAIDNVLNQPGSGGYVATTGSRIGGLVGTDLNGTTGQLAVGIIQNLGTDLRNDHPVSMQYAGGGFTGANGTISGTSRDADFTATTRVNGNQLMAQAAPAGSGLNTVFWIDRTGSGVLNSRDRRDVILYSRTGDNQPYVECGSCHDPHNVENPTFLRVANIAPNTTFPNANGGPSALCLTCHVK